jgi:hypothetical protein
LAKPNYSFEKRQRELAKKKKKEENKPARAAGGGADDELTPNDAARGLVDDAPEATEPDAAGTPPAQP